MKKFMELIKNEKAGPAVALKGLLVILILFLSIMLLIDTIYLTICYNYVKTQMDMANRSVYSEIDATKLANRVIYIDPVKAEAKFYEKLRQNLNLDENMVPEGVNLRIEGAIEIANFKVYNLSDLPAKTPTGTEIDKVSVHSQVRVHIKPIFFGYLGDVEITPFLDTDIPDELLKSFHPI